MGLGHNCCLVMAKPTPAVRKTASPYWYHENLFLTLCLQSSVEACMRAVIKGCISNTCQTVRPKNK